MALSEQVQFFLNGAVLKIAPQDLPQFKGNRLRTARKRQVRNSNVIGHFNSPSLLCGNATMAKAGGESILSGNGES